MKYLMTFTTQPSLRVTFEYSVEEGLLSIQFEGIFTDMQKVWILTQSPPTLGNTRLEQYFESNKIRITPFEEDLSFQFFWQKYNFKHGNKPRAERLWNALTDAEKAQAFTKLKKYLYELASSSIEQAHASTWLNQRRWEN
jgi:hypothetical protein